MIKGIGHVGIIVKDLDKAVSLYHELFGLEALSEVTEWPGEGMKSVILKAGGQTIEVMQPTDPNGGLAKFLAQRGEGMHHINFEVTDLDGLVKSLEEKGTKLMGRSPDFCFVHPKSTGGVLIELIKVSK